MSTPTGPMRCLSVRQPYAWAICAGVKTIENRSRGTAYRGLIAIHAGMHQSDVKELVKGRGLRVTPSQFPYGAIIGVAELIAVEEMNESLESNPHAAGPVCWRLKNARMLPMVIASKGKLSLYSLTAEESDKVRGQLAGLAPHELTQLDREWASALVDEYDTWLSRAVTYDNLDQPDDWVRCLDRAVAIDGTNIDLLYYRAYARYASGKHLDLAVVDCNRVIESEPDHANAYMVRAEAYRLLGDITRADADEARAEAIEPGIRESWNQPDDEDVQDEEEEEE